MGIYIHAGALCLFQQLFHVLQVVSADEDARVVAHAQVHLRDLRMSVARGVGFVEQRHHFHPIFARLQYQCCEVICRKTVVGGSHQCPLHEFIDVILFLLQVVSMFCVGSHPLQSVDGQFPQRAHIFVLTGQNAHFEGFLRHFCFGFSAPVCTLVGDVGHVSACRDQTLFGGAAHLVCHQDAGDQPALVEVGIGDRHEQAICNKAVDLGNLNSQYPQAYRVVGYPFAKIQQQVLQVGHLGRFPADTLYGATLVSTGFLTLITKHLFHSYLNFLC